MRHISLVTTLMPGQLERRRRDERAGGRVVHPFRGANGRGLLLLSQRRRLHHQDNHVGGDDLLRLECLGVCAVEVTGGASKTAQVTASYAASDAAFPPS